MAPKFLTDPVTGEQVWIAAATLQDFKVAQKKRRPPWPLARRFLVTVPSPQQRCLVYERAAAALAELEARVLPPYGGRKWQCLVTIKEEKSATGTSSSSSPYFCWHKRGRLELAAWPHIVEKMPDPPRFPGYYVNGVGGNTTNRNKRSKETRATAGADGGGDEKSNIVATALLLSEESKYEQVPGEAVAEEEGEAEEEEVLSDELLNMRDLQEREASGVSALAWSERWRVPLPTIQYKWISPLRQSFSSRKSAWEHAVQLCKQEVLLDKVLTGYGANGKPLKLAQPPTRKTVLTAGKLRFERDGLWVVGQEEVWGLERLTEKVEAQDAVAIRAAASMEDLAAARAHAERNATELASMTCAFVRDASLSGTEAAALSLPEDDAGQGTATKKSRRLTGLSYFVQCNRTDHRQKRLKELSERQRSSVASAVAVTPSATHPSSAIDALSPFVPPVTDMTPSTPETSNALQSSKKQAAVSFTLRDAANELRDLWKSMSEHEKQRWTDVARKRQDEIDEKIRQEDSAVSGHVNGSNEVEGSSSAKATHSNEVSSSEFGDLSLGAANLASEPFQSDMYAVTEFDAVSRLPNDSFRVQMGGSVISTSPSPPDVVGDAVVDSIDDSDKKQSGSTSPTSATQKVAKSATLPLLTPSIMTPFQVALAKKQAEFTRSKKWRLNEEQIKKCYVAGLEHYDQIMRTVTARDLTRELQDGFDLLRERGKGRWDMNLPEWDSHAYSFLNDTQKSPWMPLVREILGKDVVLIHKGMFLSMPGSSKQVYHQDGPHLTTQYQKPCHAINVFIPLVNLTLDNGPTEFCLGSHILGHEEFNENFLDIPTVAAGTPIIFDYRLGHRGLANSSKTCRPIVYCTYAAAANGKEFRDSVNFSQKRYHRIGELVEKGLTREERAEKRKRSIEEQQIEEGISASTALPERIELHADSASSNGETGTKKARKVRKQIVTPERLSESALPESEVYESVTTAVNGDATVIGAPNRMHEHFKPQSDPPTSRAGEQGDASVRSAVPAVDVL